MQTDRERIEALERTVRLLAETTRDALTAFRDHEHYGAGLRPAIATVGAVDRALGRLDATLSTLGVGPPRARGRDGGEGRE